MKKLFFIIALAAAFTIFFGCRDLYSLLEQSSFSAGEDVTKIITDEGFVQSAFGVESSGETFYSSSNEAVAIVNENTGEVNLLSFGTAFITASNVGDGLYQPATDMYELNVTDTKFITTWTTDSDGMITIPVYGEFDYDYIIEWGDGGIDSGSSRTITHQYETAGTYTISISGTFPGIYFKYYEEIGSSEPQGEILSIDNWGIIKWQSMNGAFTRCINLVCNAHDVPDLSNVTDMSYMFCIAESFNTDISGWDVSSVTDMSWMFFAAFSFNTDISGWDVSSVTDMSYMFYGARSFNTDISGWDVSSVTDMNSMFNAAESFSNKDLSGWNVTNVTSHTYFSDGWGSGNIEPSW